MSGGAFKKTVGRWETETWFGGEPVLTTLAFRSPSLGLRGIQGLSSDDLEDLRYIVERILEARKEGN